ncbi:hypothetical protein EON79_03805 [bacterium]|nr:MAG: hypothetical protein EON79_03805 [bacterium]
MTPEQKYLLIRNTAGVLATVGLYSVLYKENKFYRFFEHVFLGLASGWTLVALWTETLKSSWWDKMVGTSASDGTPAVMGNWAYALLLPIGLTGYLVFNRKHNWMSRIPIGIILGLWSGQQIQVWWNTYGPQIDGTLKPILPNTMDRFTVPAAAAPGAVYPSQAITNFLFVMTVLCVLSYFLFSFDVKSKTVRTASNLGRYLLMIGFGAIFGSTVMMRFTLLIDRMYFIWIEWFRDSILLQVFGIKI